MVALEHRSLPDNDQTVKSICHVNRSVERRAVFWAPELDISSMISGN